MSELNEKDFVSSFTNSSGPKIHRGTTFSIVWMQLYRCKPEFRQFSDDHNRAP